MSDRTEALNWLRTQNAQRNRCAFAGNCFDNELAISFVQKLYETGAVKVELDPMRDDYADTLYITLPEDKSKRLDLVPVVYKYHPDEVEADWNSDEPIMLWWD